MYTKDIVLQEVSYTEFERLKRYWNREGLHVADDFVLSRVENPVIWPLVSDDRMENYKGLLEHLLGHPHLTQIAVNNSGRWERHKSWEIDSPQLERIASIAAQDRRKKNYFEAKFSTPEGYYETVQKATIEFAELCFGTEDYRVVGIQTIVPYPYRDWFTIASEDKEYFINHGLWVPEEGRKVRVNTDI